jgi:hypothetical protein
MARTSSSPVLTRYNDLTAAFNAKHPRAAKGCMLTVCCDFSMVDAVDSEGELCRAVASVRLICDLNSKMVPMGTGFGGLEHIKAAMKTAGILDEKRGNGTTKYSAVSVEIPAAQMEEVAYQLLLQGVRCGNTGSGTYADKAATRLDSELMAQARREVGA